jgi:hypothetical protein
MLCDVLRPGVPPNLCAPHVHVDVRKRAIRRNNKVPWSSSIVDNREQVGCLLGVYASFSAS